VDQRPEAQRLAAAHPVGERLVEQGAGSGRALTREALEVALDPEQPAQNLKRVSVDVEVVIWGLDDAPRRLELGQDGARDPQLVHQLQATQRVGTGHQPSQLGELALPRRLAGPGGLGTPQLDRLGIRLQAPELRMLRGDSDTLGVLSYVKVKLSTELS